MKYLYFKYLGVAIKLSTYAGDSETTLFVESKDDREGNRQIRRRRLLGYEQEVRIIDDTDILPSEPEEQKEGEPST